jgi:hypothetical protein
MPTYFLRLQQIHHHQLKLLHNQQSNHQLQPM